jgi:hypothetical protein
MLKHGIINPLNVHGLRRLEYCPPHFERLYFDIKTSEKNIIIWILENLQGRFFLGDVTDEKHFRKCVAFEIHSEKILFALQLDIINKFLVE